MNVLVIYTYPHHKSLNGAFLQKVIDGCSENDQVHEAKVIDLYKENFHPALLFNETKRRRDMHKDPDLASYRELIT